MLPEVHLVAAARPNLPKLAALWHALAAGPDFCQPILLHTGQHEDPAMFGVHFADLGLPPMDPVHDRAMVCGSLAFNVDVKVILEGFGLVEGANSDPRQFVIEKAFVGDGI